MKLNSSDVSRLYGKKLFVLDGWEKSAPTLDPGEVKEEKPIDKPVEISEEPEVQVELVSEPVVVPEVKEEVAPVEAKEEEVVETVPTPDLSRFSSGNPVVWKMKPSSKLALILQKSEFSNRDLTGLLKTSLVKAGIDPALIGFGVIEDDCKAINLDEMAVHFALICHSFGGDLSSPLDLSGKKIWLVPALGELSAQPEKQKELDAAMSELANLL